MYDDTYSSLTLNEKVGRSLWESTPLLPPHTSHASQHPLFSHNLLQAVLPSSLLLTPLEVAPPESSRSLPMTSLCFWPLAAFPHFAYRIRSCVSSERPLLLQKALAKLCTSILWIFPGQVPARQWRCEICYAASHSTDLCSDLDFLRRVRGSSASVFAQPTEHHAGWLRYAKLHVVIKWNGPWSIKIRANYSHIN